MLTNIEDELAAMPPPRGTVPVGHASCPVPVPDRLRLPPRPRPRTGLRERLRELRLVGWPSRTAGAVALLTGRAPPHGGNELPPNCHQQAGRNLVDPPWPSGYTPVSARVLPAGWGRSSVGRALASHSRGWRVHS